MILAYVMRHGSTDISPQPEGWKQIGLNLKGWREARDGAHFLRDFTKLSAPKPSWGVSSDLARAYQTLAVVVTLLHIPTRLSLIGLRAYDADKETPTQYEARNIETFERLLETAKQQHTLPLIVCHRSSTAFLGKCHKVLLKEPDYGKDSLLEEGGILAITDGGLMPLFRAIKENWPDVGVEQCGS